MVKETVDTKDTELCYKWDRGCVCATLLRTLLKQTGPGEETVSGPVLLPSTSGPMRIFCVFPFLSFHIKSGTYWALHRGRDIFFWNTASMICIIILIIAGLTFIEHLKSSLCKIHICFVAFLRAWRGNCSLHSTAIKSRSAWNRCYVTQKQRSALQKKKFFP